MLAPRNETVDNPFTILIPFRNGHATIGRLLESLPPELPVIVVDDCSNEYLQLNRENTKVIRLPQRGYFSGAVNEGIAACATDVLILNQDAYLEGVTWLAQTRGWQDMGYGIAGEGVKKHPAWPRGYCQGTCMFLSREAINKVGLFNEIDYPLWGATAHWQLRACRAGFKALPCEVGGLHHAEGRGRRYGDSITAALQSEPDKRDLFIRTPPAISVVIPLYNYGRYLRDALSSLLGGPSCLGDCPPQTFQSFEAIIVDDASTDDSWKIAQTFADDWKAIKAIRNPRNLGTAATINAGIRQSYGRYVTVLSADDMMESGRLDKLYRMAEANPHRFIYDDLYLFKNGKRFEQMKLPEYDFDKVLYKNGMHSGIFYSREAWRECNGYPEIMRDGREDWAFNVALGARGYCGMHLKEPLYLYRREGHNRSLRNADMQWRETFLGRLRDLYPNLYAGERPTMCCRSGRKKAKSRAAQRGATQGTNRAESLQIGAEGMTLLEYVGASGPKPYTAPATRQTYVFGGSHRTGYVDNRDVDWFLERAEGRKLIFHKATPIEPHLASMEIESEQALG